MQLGLNRLLEQLQPHGTSEKADATPVAEAPPEPSHGAPAPLDFPAPTASLPPETDRELWRSPPFDYTPFPSVADSVLAALDPLPYLSGSQAAAVVSAEPAVVAKPAVAAKPTVAAKPVVVAGPAVVAEPEEAPATPETRRAPALEHPRPAAAPVDYDFGFSDSAVETPGWRKHLVKLAVAAAVVCGVGYFAIWPGSGNESPNASARAVATAGPEWIADWSRSDQGDYISLFEPSWDWSDYLVETAAVPGEDIAWVFRARDPDNYYALRLEDRAAGQLSLVRYSVVRGQQTAPIETPLTEPPVADSYGVRLEVRGTQFSLFLGGKLSAEWTDTQLGQGGFGVIGRNTDLAHTGDVRVTRLAQDSAYRSLPPTSRSLTPTLAAITITRMEGKESN